jgi:hypothetical protein
MSKELNRNYKVQREFPYSRGGSGMHEQIGLYLEKLERKNHLCELIKNKNLSIAIEINQQEYYLFFQNGKLRKSVDTLKDYISTRIGGDEKAITSLLNGELKLRVGEAMNLLHVSASFRNKLLLESLFYLGGQKNS